MDFDEYEYLEKTVEESEKDAAPAAKKSEKVHRRRDTDDDSGGRRKKPRDSDGENGAAKRDDRERSSRHRSDERERDRHHHRSSRDGVKERERGSVRDKERRDREREEKERERPRRSRSRHEGGEREKEKEVLRESQRELDTRDSRRFKDKKEAEPEADPERDQRTVFAYQMSLKATERDVYEFFSKAVEAESWYIEFYDVMSVPMAIAMTGQLLLGQPVMVKPSEAEKNLVQSNASGGGSVTGPYGAVDRKLYVGNLHFNMTELQLKQVFEAFGPVELVQLPTDPETGYCKGFGFIQFNQLEHAKAAQSLNGNLEIAGRVIKVSSVTDHVAAQDSVVKATDLDDDDGGGLTLNAQSRALLMQRLDRSGTATSVTGPVGVPAMNDGSFGQQAMTLAMNGQSTIPAQALPALMTSMAPEPIGKPSECLLLKNMFDAATETDPEFDLDIKEDVQEECSKYGRVKHIHVDKNSSGYVYLRFESVEGASGAQQAMHHRWFARRLISAVFLQPYEYDAKFKGAA